MRSTTTSKLYDFSLGWKAKITTLYTWKRLMVRYFSSPNEQHLQCTAEVMRNFWPLLHDEVYLQLLFSSDKVNRWAGTRWHLVNKKMFSRGNNPWEWKWPLGTLRFSFFFFKFLAFIVGWSIMSGRSKHVWQLTGLSAGTLYILDIWM